MNNFRKVLLLALLSNFAYSSQKSELNCLALNIYHEARSSNLADQAAVVDVVFNRVRSSKYPNTICSVVKQAKLSKWHLQNTGKKVPIKHMCQFSWFCDGKSDEPTEEDAWEQANILAIQVYKDRQYRGISEGAIMYHTRYVKPYWAKHYQFVGTIGQHKYYRTKN